MESRELILTAKYTLEIEGKEKTIDIALENLVVLMKVDEQEATVDADTAIRRCIMLAQENMLLKNALQEAADQLRGPKIQVATMDDIPEAPHGR